jgi:Domain of unknown function (DUF4105)
MRSNYRRSRVHLYPIRVCHERICDLLLDMLGRLIRLRDQPEFYNSLTNTCTTNILRYVRRISPRRFPLSVKALLPAYSDRLACDLGLIDTDLGFEAVWERFLITERALLHHDDPNFSGSIRG